MNKIKNKLLENFRILALIICLIFPFYTIDVYAAGMSVSANTSSVNVGESFTVTVTLSEAAGGPFNVSISGPGEQTSNIASWIDSSSASFTVKAVAAGAITVNVRGTIADFAVTPKEWDASGAVTVNSVAPQTNTPNTPNTPETPQTPNTQTPTTPTVKKSNDASLASLSVSEGSLSPEFSASTTDYTVAAGADATKISIDASANDANARVSGAGEKDLKPGKNEFTISCTAEDGTVRNYVIVVNVDETPTVFTNYDNKKLGVVRDISSVSKPAGFEEITATLEGQEIPAWKNSLSGISIVYLIDEANEKNFYLYDEATKSVTSIYKPMALLGKNVAVIDVPSELQTKANMIFGEVEVDGIKLPGWTFEETSLSNYAVIYVMDENGKLSYYLYEKTENSLQLYANTAPITQDAYQALLDEHDSALQLRMWLIIALLVSNILAIILLVAIMINKQKKRKQQIERRTHITKLEKEEDNVVLTSESDIDTHLQYVANDDAGIVEDYTQETRDQD